ncbi:MAG: hypothetical protein HRU23_18435 [Gammaproteobacteria bacterium]|nr:hypothetical protein [Gammaproteobacteria bacterium]
MTSDVIVDQKDLLVSLLTTSHGLDNESLIYCAWAAALNSQSEYVVELVAQSVSAPNDRQLRAIQLAISRMGVTNPYFLSRQFVDVRAGGSLTELNFRPLSQLNIDNELAYHYACVVVSLMNGGHICLRSHIDSLKTSNQSDQQIDAVMRLGAVCSSLARHQFAAKFNF